MARIVHGIFLFIHFFMALESLSTCSPSYIPIKQTDLLQGEIPKSLQYHMFQEGCFPTPNLDGPRKPLCQR